MPAALRCGVLSLVLLCSADARLIAGRQILYAQMGTETPTPAPRPLYYPGRPTGICTSRGHTCSSIYEDTKPYHVSVQGGGCETARGKTLRDRFGRPLTIRYTYNSRTYVANREQVCDLSGHYVSTNRSRIAMDIDDIVWKNLSIWAKEMESNWAAPVQKAQYIKCHEYFAAFHCSSMFPNCTAEYLDQKPALPCKEVCEKAMEECTWSDENFFLPYSLQCAQYPSESDHYKKCSAVFPTYQYIQRVSAAPRFYIASLAAGMAVLLAILHVS